MVEDYIQEAGLPGVFIITRPIVPDDRGFFREVFRKSDLEIKTGFTIDFVQMNHSHSVRGTLRGIHRAPWHKLVTVARGRVQQVVVDLREDSSSFGKYISVNLEANKAILIPAFCGNAFLVLSEEADYVYNVTDYWSPGSEKSVIYNDSDINITWNIADIKLSEKDFKNPTLREVFSEKF